MVNNFTDTPHKYLITYVGTYIIAVCTLYTSCITYLNFNPIKTLRCYVTPSLYNTAHNTGEGL